MALWFFNMGWERRLKAANSTEKLFNYLANSRFFADLCYLYFNAVAGLGFWHRNDVASNS